MRKILMRHLRHVLHLHTMGLQPAGPLGLKRRVLAQLKAQVMPAGHLAYGQGRTGQRLSAAGCTERCGTRKAARLASPAAPQRATSIKSATTADAVVCEPAPAP